MNLSRRDFLRTTGTALAGATLAARLGAQNEETAEVAIAGRKQANPLLVFSKPFQQLGAVATADLVAKIGWDGIECPVRKGGQIEPGDAAEKLPRFMDEFHKRNLDIPVIVTDITAAHQAHAKEVLQAAAKAGVKQVRLGFWKYDYSRPILPQVSQVSKDLKAIGELCGELGLRAGVENHSGATMFGAPIWDIVTALRESGAEHVGIFFDIGHATIEGGMSWPVQAKLAQPYFTTIYVKDFIWAKEKDKWRMRWVPLGQGMVDKGFFKTLLAGGYVGPICQHHEYKLGGEADMLDHFRQDLKVLKGWLHDASRT